MLNLLINPIANLLGKVIPDKDERDKMAHEIATLAEKQAHDVVMAQIAVNEREAQHRSIFVAGWRPFVGWVCGVAFAAHFILFPSVQVIATYTGYDITLPHFDLTTLTTVLGGLLGLGGLRTYEKLKGKTK